MAAIYPIKKLLNSRGLNKRWITVDKRDLLVNSLNQFKSVNSGSVPVEKLDFPMMWKYCVEFGDDIVASKICKYLPKDYDRTVAYESIFLASLKAQRWAKAANALRKIDLSRQAHFSNLFLEASPSPELCFQSVKAALESFSADNASKEAALDNCFLRIAYSGQSLDVNALLALGVAPSTNISESRPQVIEALIRQYIYLAENSVPIQPSLATRANAAVESLAREHYLTCRDAGYISYIARGYFLRSGKVDSALKLFKELCLGAADSQERLSLEFSELECIAAFLENSLRHFQFSQMAQKHKRELLRLRAESIIAMLLSTPGSSFLLPWQEAQAVILKTRICVSIDNFDDSSSYGTFLMDLVDAFSRQGGQLDRSLYEFVLWARACRRAADTKQRQVRVSESVFIAEKMQRVFGNAVSSASYASLLLACRPSETASDDGPLETLQLDPRVWTFVSEMKQNGFLSDFGCLKTLLQLLIVTNNFRDVENYLEWMSENGINRPILLFNTILERARFSVEASNWAICAVPYIIEEEQLLMSRDPCATKLQFVRSQPTSTTFLYLLQCALKAKSKPSFKKFSILYENSGLEVSANVLNFIRGSIDREQLCLNAIV